MRVRIAASNASVESDAPPAAVAGAVDVTGLALSITRSVISSSRVRSRSSRDCTTELTTLETKPPKRPKRVVSNAKDRPDATFPSSCVTRSISSILTLVVRKSENPPTARLIPSTVPMNPRMGIAQMKSLTAR